jgi:plasmid stabilization system protein ParE
VRVRYTAQAVGELEEILSYLEERNPAAAAALSGRIEARRPWVEEQ